MKNQIILWLSSIIIVFLIGYIKSVTSENYPITGTFGIEGKKVSYKLDKESFTKTYYSNIIISDIDEIEAKLLLKKENSQNEIGYTLTNMGLECQILKLKPGKSIQYRIIIKHNEKTYKIPENDFVTLTFWGNIPSPVNILHFILLYGGLMISIRSLLELFNKNKNLKRYSIVACTLFITLTAIINPLKNSYKLGAINNYVPQVTELFQPALLLILLIWIMGSIFIFNKKYVGTVTIFIVAVTVLLFFFI